MSGEVPDQNLLSDRQRKALARLIGAELGETDPTAIMQIRRILKHCGPVQTRVWLDQTWAIERAGGMWLGAPYERRRTPGGVFFTLVRDALEQEGRGDVAGRIFVRPRRASRPDHPASAPPDPPFPWEDRAALVRSFAPEEKGSVIRMRTRMVVRPGRIVVRGQTAIAVVRRPDPPPGFPKGVPAPAQPAGECTIVMSRKQWERVAPIYHATPDDRLIVEGYEVWDPATGASTLHAMSVTTIAVERARIPPADPPAESS